MRETHGRKVPKTHKSKQDTVAPYKKLRQLPGGLDWKLAARSQTRGAVVDIWQSGRSEGSDLSSLGGTKTL